MVDSQSVGVGEIHQRFPGESSPSPTSQYLLCSEMRTLLATVAMADAPLGSSSIRIRIPGFRHRGNLIPHP